ncbi:hypothetical protein B0H16DRAFT_1741011 [Mycena metata]|uniref:Uncharacterized protein n=1 Tax=Mycena metata TaxID=1033252 RepID=A0AAD7MHV4_9AGAR|nr:hypothetical protein B0H16DRAFT_1741011 [Mycena metata]
MNPPLNATRPALCFSIGLEALERLFAHEILVIIVGLFLFHGVIRARRSTTRRPKPKPAASSALQNGTKRLRRDHERKDADEGSESESEASKAATPSGSDLANDVARSPTARDDPSETTSLLPQLCVRACALPRAALALAPDTHWQPHSHSPAHASKNVALPHLTARLKRRRRLRLFSARARALALLSSSPSHADSRSHASGPMNTRTFALVLSTSTAIRLVIAYSILGFGEHGCPPARPTRAPARPTGTRTRARTHTSKAPPLPLFFALAPYSHAHTHGGSHVSPTTNLRAFLLHILRPRPTPSTNVGVLRVLALILRPRPAVLIPTSPVSSSSWRREVFITSTSPSTSSSRLLSWGFASALPLDDRSETPPPLSPSPSHAHALAHHRTTAPALAPLHPRTPSPPRAIHFGFLIAGIISRLRGARSHWEWRYQSDSKQRLVVSVLVLSHVDHISPDLRLPSPSYNNVAPIQGSTQIKIRLAGTCNPNRKDHHGGRGTVVAVKKNREDLEELCSSSTEIITILHDQIKAHGNTAAVKFKGLCEELESYLKAVILAIRNLQDQSKGLRGRVKEFLKSTSLTDEIAGYQTQIQGVCSKLKARFS